MTTQALVDEACNEKKFKKTIQNVLGVSFPKLGRVAIALTN